MSAHFTKICYSESMIKFLRVIILGLFLSSSANAEWTEVSTTTAKDVYYVDFENIRVEDKLIYYWELMKYGTPTKDGTLSHKIYQVIDCSNFSSKPLRFIFYTDRNGTSDPDSQKSLINEWTQFPPDSVAMDSAKKLCKNI